MTQALDVSILGNSHAFLREAAAKAAAAEDDPREWQFAVIHVAGALELTLKALLVRIHPALVYESVDNPNRTVGSRVALSRLRDPLIGGLPITDAEANKIQRVIDLRNEFIHASFELRAEHAAAKFFEAFAFVSDFQSRHLDAEVDEIVRPADFGRLLAAEKGSRELATRAGQRIDEEEIPGEWIWVCPDCSHPTFVAFDGINTCYTCRFADEVRLCPQCGSAHFTHEISDFSDALDWAEESGGQARLHNDFGYREWQACETCLPTIMDDIRDQRLNEEYYDRMRDEFYQRRGFDPLS